jgi:glycosyltransferase 2 family protein
MPKQKLTKMTVSSLKARLIILAACLLLLYVLLPQIDSFSNSFAVLKKTDWLPALAAFIIVVWTYAIAACTYWLLALRPLRFGRTLIIEGASAFANRILPAGLGGLTLNVEYLRHERHTLAQAVVVAGTNNALGFIGHMLLLGTALLIGREAVWSGLHLPSINVTGTTGLLVALAASIGLVVAITLHRRVVRALRDVVRQLRTYRKRPLRVFAALGCSVVLTISFMSIFYLTSLAVGASLTAWEVLIICSLGIIVGTAVPTPGGLGGVEAGLVAGSIAYGQSASVALAAALLFRLLTYWLPLIPGFVLFMVGRRYFSS